MKKDFSTLTDEELIELLRADDSDAWTYILERYAISASHFYHNQTRVKSYSLDTNGIFGLLWEDFKAS
ncbi:MAG: hypothetical protein Q4G59_07200, partial [Planctomycetia bacterium]|nr:hypothetical protein [Planctomycetia bacterium]